LNRQFERYLQITLLLLDFLALNIVFFIFQLIFTKTIHFESSNAYFKYIITANVAWLLLAFFLRTYSVNILFNFEDFTKRTIQVFLVWIILILFYLFFSRELTVSRFFIITSTACFGFGLLVNKFIYLGIFRYFKNSDFLIKKYLFSGIMKQLKN
jgi:putative colanic acid biosynthesis UDP-glucose lipid carrier transferase